MSEADCFRTWNENLTSSKRIRRLTKFLISLRRVKVTLEER